MINDHEAFSRQAKIALGQYLNHEEYGLDDLYLFLNNLQLFDLESLEEDRDKLAFWINMYNGLTNYQIIKNRLENSVWEKQDFFTDQCLQIGAFSFSLDDIEHGILRKNGQRRKGKSEQFSAADKRCQFMVKNFDFRIHFALNCGSVSCPPISFYRSSDINQQLDLAEQAFSLEEFRVNEEEKRIDCSSIFIWYQADFGNHYLNDSVLSQYTIFERPYTWKIQ